MDFPPGAKDFRDVVVNLIPPYLGEGVVGLGKVFRRYIAGWDIQTDLQRNFKYLYN